MSMFLLPDYRVRQRDFLLNISRALTSQLDLVEVLRMILQAATSMLAGEVGIIALRNGEGFGVRASIGIQPEQVQLFNDLLADLPTQAAEQRDVELFQNRMRAIARKINLQLRQVVSLPMAFGDDMLGILFIFRTYAGTPNENDYRLLQSFADQAAIAVHNARTYEMADRERRRLAAILEHTADGVMILDPELHVERWNQALARMTGLSAEQAQGRPHDVVIRWKRMELGQRLEDAVSDGWPYRTGDHTAPDTIYVQGDLERLDGSVLSVGVTYAPLTLVDGRLVNVIANVRDITHFREAEQLKSTFISVVSHELKTPVALIKGYADTLNREDADWDEHTIRSGLSVIEDEADRLTELIENLLAASKLQAEGMEVHLDDVSLPALAQQSIERFQTQTDRHTLRADFPPDFPIILGDETRLRQVIDNLVSNAIKYSPDGGEVLLSGAYGADWVQLDVHDQGIGVPADQLERIFERFHRVDNSLAKKTQGTGLGLYLAHAVIKAHDGSIWASNNPGGGSTFSFVLPRRE